MKRILMLLWPVLIPVALLSQGNWTQICDFPGVPRAFAAAFSIGSTGFVAGGRQADAPLYGYLKDFFAYDQSLDSWIQLPDLPVPLSDACAFSIGNKGYIVGGQNEGGYHTTMFIWDNTTHLWTETNPLPTGLNRIRGNGFTIGNYGYITSGIDQNGSALLRDLWQYNPQNGQWLRKADNPWSTRYDAACFVIHDKGYLMGGVDGNSQILSDLCRYNSQSDTWTWAEAFPDQPRTGMQGFGLGSFGYITGGNSVTDSPTMLNWQYNSSLDTWLDVVPQPTFWTYNGVSFTMNNIAYVCTGHPSSTSKQTWRYVPGELGIQEKPAEMVRITPNPASDWVMVDYKKEFFGILTLFLTDLTGKTLRIKTVFSIEPQNTTSFSLTGLSSGCYFLTLRDESGKRLGSAKVMKE